MTLHFAPLQGFTDGAYRRLHSVIFPGADVYYTPFVRIEKGAPRRQDINRLQAARESGEDALVPQIIFRDIDEFAILRNAVVDCGFSRIDLNLGCPYPMQTRKGRGAALLADAATMEKVAQAVNSDTDVTYSVKMRLGLEDKEQWRRIMPVLDSMKLAYITVHPRIATQLYGGELFMDEFEKIYNVTSHPLVYNGDICKPEDIDSISSRFPNLEGLMVGRGLLARPSLYTEWLSGQRWSSTLLIESVLKFHEALLQEYESTLCGQAQILQKIKPFWEYMEPLIGHKVYKGIHKAGSLAKYRQAVAAIES